MKVTKIWLAFALVAGGCSTQTIATRGPAVYSPPASAVAWYGEIHDIQGINLPHLDDDAHGLSGETLSSRFIDDPSFQSNLNAMGWNFYRLPVVWSKFANVDGTLDFPRLEEALGPVVGDLVEKLKLMHLAHPEVGRIVLAIDFHQFKFGPDCGNEGIPSGFVDMKDSGASDVNCQFKGFDKFWKNENGVQDKWISFIVETMRRILPFAEDNTAWLTIAVEPINEPWPGDPKGPLSSNTISAVRGYYKTYESQDDQSEKYLVPFYQKVLLALESTFSAQKVQKYLFLFDPYISDFLNFRFFDKTVMKGSSYRTADSLLHFPKSGASATWLAAPHFYGGGSDPWLRRAQPALLNEMTAFYPNLIFNREQIINRVKYMADTFKKVGMETFLGEVGTYEDLIGNDDLKNGYVQYVKDMKEGVSKYCKGFVWWGYIRDDSNEQNAYYLLYGSKSKKHASSSVFDQRLKCDTDNSLVQTVFDRCP